MKKKKVITAKLSIRVLTYVLIIVYLWSLPRLDETSLDFTITLFLCCCCFYRWVGWGNSLTQEGGEQSRKLLFVHQTAWQKRLLRLYGNDICFLDATYKTTRYALPLFFIAVKTNVDYQVVRSFVTEDETVCSIKEALEVVREWNPDWSPHLFMTDNCSQEIQAIENLFPGKSELMAPQPAFKFQDATVRLWK